MSTVNVFEDPGVVVGGRGLRTIVQARQMW